jgi:hypothetical protein
MGGDRKDEPKITPKCCTIQAIILKRCARTAPPTAGAKQPFCQRRYHETERQNYSELLLSGAT